MSWQYLLGMTDAAGGEIAKTNAEAQAGKQSEAAAEQIEEGAPAAPEEVADVGA